MTASITDFSQFTSLRASAERNDPAALREVASQFEALFVQSMLKNMRGAQLAEPMFDSKQMGMYQGMFDQQISLEMASGRGIGLADMLVRQLGGEVRFAPPAQASYTLPAAAAGTASRWQRPDEFVRELWPHAERAARALDVPPRALLAQAALETGWGQHVMERPDGSSSFNLFGIKAGPEWSGSSVARPTIEFEDGLARRTVASFRAYPDVAAAFDDYIGLLRDNPRYADVPGRNEAAFGAALQDAGYATDPQYAAKLEAVLRGETLARALQRLKLADVRPITLANAPVDAD